MARTNNRLNALTVTRLHTQGLYPDGGGLYLQIAQGGARSWVYRFMLQGRAREMGLGSLRDVGLAKARVRAAEARKLRAEGMDPIEHRQARKRGAILAASRAMTFENCAKAYIEANKIAWRNAKHVRQWESTLRTYCYPVFGPVSVQDLDTALVLKVLEPIWSRKTETASRLRGRIEAVLDWATARGYRTGENPARWRSHVENLLPSRSQVRKVQHHPALPYTQIGEFVRSLREQSGMAALALEFLILTAARTSEVVGARWKEIDLEEALWTIPAHRIKARREHRVPLAPRAVAILKSLQPEHPQEFVFAGGKANTSLSNMALLALLKRMDRTDITAHGFRSTFRDWAAERTNFPREVAEMALAHAVGDKVEAAYRRGDLFEKRRNLATQWGVFCETYPRGRVVALPSRTERLAEILRSNNDCGAATGAGF